MSAAAQSFTVGGRTIDSMLRLVAAAELHVACCPPCRGLGRIPEYFQAIRVVDATRLQRVPCARATRWHVCESCADLRLAIIAARASL